MDFSPPFSVYLMLPLGLLAGWALVWFDRETNWVRILCLIPLFVTSKFAGAWMFDTLPLTPRFLLLAGSGAYLVLGALLASWMKRNAGPTTPTPAPDPA